MTNYLYGANVQANGIRQHYLRYGGQGLPLILIPGITSPAVTWGFVAERLGQHFDVYVLDVRGRGLSEASPTLDYSLDAQAADIAALADVLGLAHYAVLGHSMGGRIAIRMARRFKPQGLERLVIVDPPVSGPGRRPYPSGLPWYVDSTRQSLRGMSAEDMRAFCPTWTEEQLRLRAEWLHTCDERAIVASYNSFHEDDIHQDLPHISLPTLLMVAGRGNVLLPEDIKEIQGLMPDVTVARVENAGHMIPWDDEEGFYQAFGYFLGAPV
ncbi:N-formylmaleamate deformylase [Pseudomonas duriflava]|uniref:N-formylmaleamate deformylase n=1 Tax=Pseudomonas duriflava TaxID=459528 RepID=A0A562QJ49_9PSED|nr:alpha/beta hydrolase [Pseudomonas duriflava]TWI56764.1 N-formylmaleamate deformylase [Pseudomonas duriflava]